VTDRRTDSDKAIPNNTNTTEEKPRYSLLRHLLIWGDDQCTISSGWQM